MNNIYNAGLYIRLSKEDKDKNISESIINQKALLLNYLKENNINNYKIYIDEGYSGTNFNRPSFKNMIEDIKNKKINMVITKDMSRLGRDYIGVGELIDKFFPINNIRFISLTDNIDTYLDNYSNDLAPFKAIINDMYAKDISKKIRASIRIKQKEGKWVGARPPFGYKADKKNKNHLVIDKGKALIVKKIFSLFTNGYSISEITNYLIKNKIKTPSEYTKFKYNNRNINYGVWTSKTIKDILSNPIYTGNLVQNRRQKLNYKINKIIKNKEEDYIIVPNTHKKIINVKDYEYTKKLLEKNININKRKEKYLLSNLMYCYECKNKIIITSRRKKDNRCYTICTKYNKDKTCCMHSNNYDILEDIVIKELKEYFLNKLYNDIIMKDCNLNIDNILNAILKNRNIIINIIDKIEIHNNKIIDVYI